MISVSSFDVTQHRASAASLSLPLWYSMLNVNLASDSTQQCWVASKLDVGHDVGKWIVVSFDNEWFP